MPVIPQTSSPPCGIISFAIPQGPPSCQHGNHLAAGGTIGGLFRDYGEEYIQVYSANRRTIELIRSIRVCRTSALGGKRITCRGCGQVRYQYMSCGNSQCPQCQPCGITALKPPCTNSTGPGRQTPTVAGQASQPHAASSLLPYHFYAASLFEWPGTAQPLGGV